MLQAEQALQSRFSLEDAAQLLQSTARPLLQPPDHQDISTSATFDIHHGSNGSVPIAAQHGTNGAASHHSSTDAGVYGLGASSNGHVSHQGTSANDVTGQNGHASSSNGSHSNGNGNGSNGFGSQALLAEAEELPIQVLTLLFFLQQFCLQVLVC